MRFTHIFSLFCVKREDLVIFFRPLPLIRTNPLSVDYGASAFASFFGRRLPTEAEWLYATIKGTPSSQSSSTGTPIRWNSMDMENMMSGMMKGDWRKEKWSMDQNKQANTKSSNIVLNKSKEPPPAAFFKQNKFSVRALNEGIGEWGIRTFSNLSKDKLQDNLQDS